MGRLSFCFYFFKTCGAKFLRDAAVESLIDCSRLQMLQFQLVVVHLALAIALLWWNSSSVLLAEAAPEVGEGSWWLSHNCSSLGVFSHRVRKTLEYPSTVGG